MTIVASVVLGVQALKEFQLLLHSLELWEPHVKVFVLTDSPTAGLLATIKSALKVETRVELDDYTGLSRKDMEAMSGKKYSSLWHDFMIEKTTILRHAFTATKEFKKEGVWFLDADVCLLAPLPTPNPSHRLALSPHYIRPTDEARFGRFNGGVLWIRDEGLLEVWRRATYGSRFYEQAALEDVWAAVSATEREELPIQDNFGWWRYIQSVDPPPTIESRLGFNRRLTGCGMTYDGQVLRSVHTHWGEASDFNKWIRGKLEFLARSHPPAKTFLQHMNRLFSTAPKK